MDFTGWLVWAAIYEPVFAGKSEMPLLVDCYERAYNEVLGLQRYLSAYNFKILVYNWAMHNFIMVSDRAEEPLDSLYEKYEVAENTGLLESASDASSSSTKMVGESVRQGDAQTMLLWATPYGQYVESILEQLRSVAVVI